MRILVTRAEPDALRLAAHLEALDHESTVAPLLSVSFDDAELIDLSEVQALIATSRNGLDALKAQGAHRIAAQLPLFVVGPATEKKARAMGFATVIPGGGSVATLIPAVVANADPQAGVLMHLAGDEVAGHLAEELEQHGFRMLSPIVYRMVEAEDFKADVVDQIADGEIDAVMLFSPRTAAIYVRLIRLHRLERAVGRVTHACLSAAVAKRLSPLAPLRIEVAETPTLEAMLDLVR